MSNIQNLDLVCYLCVCMRVTFTRLRKPSELYIHTACIHLDTTVMLYGPVTHESNAISR